MAEQDKYSGFPDPLASNETKLTDKYGLQVARMISRQWFNGQLIQDDSEYMRRRNWI